MHKVHLQIWTYNLYLTIQLKIICLALYPSFTSVPFFHRCLDQAKFFPPDNPVWCTEKNEQPYFEMKCCRTHMCNKEIVFNLPTKGGEPNTTIHICVPLSFCIYLNHNTQTSPCIAFALNVFFKHTIRVVHISKPN